MTETVAKSLKISFDAMEEIANLLEMRGETDKFVLLSTAVVLFALQDRFTNEEYFWRPVIRKSEVLFNAEITLRVPMIDGKTITEWAKEFIQLSH